ncbi:MAG: dihydroorotase [Bacteroidaceae bacterium]|nr:dihydroorotase [Bacteroidaceae bacterium]
MMKTIITGAKIVNEERLIDNATVVIQDEVITHVLENETCNPDPDDIVIDASGMYLFPGVIDCHVHFREPGYTYKADIESESRTAAAGGVTSYMEMPNTNPPTTTLELLEEKYDIARKNSRVNYSFFFGATNDNIDLLRQLDPHRVPGVKVFMGSSTGNLLVDDSNAMRRIFETSPLRIVAHCEDNNIIEQNIKAFKRKYKGQNDFPVRYHSRIRSVEACYEAASKAVELARQTGARLHVAHVSSERELELFDSKPLAEKQITAEACIAHLMFTTEDYDQLGTKIKCNPAVKTPEDQAALRDALTDGRIDIVATDHAPHLLDEKVGGALRAMSGMPLVQFSLVSMLELVDKGVLPLQHVPTLMSHNPATLYNIDRRGFIRPGYYADLVIVDPNANWQVAEGRYYTKCGWTPMDERTFKWKVVRTLVNGVTAYSNGIVIDGIRGKELKFI